MRVAPGKMQSAVVLFDAICRRLLFRTSQPRSYTITSTSTLYGFVSRAAPLTGPSFPRRFQHSLGHKSGCCWASVVAYRLCWIVRQSQISKRQRESEWIGVSYSRSFFSMLSRYFCIFQQNANNITRYGKSKNKQ